MYSRTFTFLRDEEVCGVGEFTAGRSNSCGRVRGEWLDQATFPFLTCCPIHSRYEVTARASLHIFAAGDAELQAPYGITERRHGQLVRALRDLVQVVGQVPEGSAGIAAIIGNR